MLNHTLAKSLLFFGAGAVLNATGARDIETMGGLIHRMPRTALAVLIGCAAISALPPLNGFASEWLIFQTILLHPELPQWGLKLMIPLAGVALALSTALAAACFVRTFGIVFLGRPRSEAAAQAREAHPWSLTAMLGFALFCVLAGIVPGAVIDAIAPTAHLLTGSRLPVQLDNAWLSIAPVEAARSSYNGLLIFIFIAISILITAIVAHRLGSRQVRQSPAWDCGFPDPRLPLSIRPAASPSRCGACSAPSCSKRGSGSICPGPAITARPISRAAWLIRFGTQPMRRLGAVSGGWPCMPTGCSS